MRNSAWRALILILVLAAASFPVQAATSFEDAQKEVVAAGKTLDTFDFDFNKKLHRALVFELATGRFIAQREDALFLGPPGTGKSHLAQALES